MDFELTKERRYFIQGCSGFSLKGNRFKPAETVMNIDIMSY